jgi:transcriptional regulator with XRE-family HTH domain
VSEYLPLAEQLRILFESSKKPDGTTYTMLEVSKAMDVSLPTLSQLRNGKITNPQLNTLRAICRFFNIPLRYFDTRSAEECYAILAEGRAGNNIEGINYIAHMAASLTPEGQRDLLTVIKWAQAAEQQLMAGNNLPDFPHLEPYDNGNS